MRQALLKDVMARLAGSVAVGLLALGALGSPQALAGIASTKHNLGTTGPGPNTFSGTGEICVFCHTPHGADTTASVPLWNRVLAAATTYTTYNTLGTSSLDGATAPVGSVSLACLSCHDGAQAMNVMINQPGSGGYNSAGAALTGTWTGVGTLTGLPKVGPDLTNDHPIGIQYGGGYASNAAFPQTDIAAGATRDTDFKAVKYANLNGNSVWWVDSGTVSGSRDKADMMLYTRTDSASVGLTGAVTAGALTGAQAFVECASCHDPHSSTNDTFLRISNTGSAVCLACHTK